VRSAATTALLAGATSLALEIVLVRMLAFFLATSLDFLAIPLALLGLAIGSMGTHLLWRGSRSDLASLAAAALFPVLASSFAFFFFVFDAWFPEIHAGEIQPARDVPWLLLSSALLIPPFAVLGALFAGLFASHPDRVGRLYAFDLAGAAAGCVVAPVLLTVLDLPETILAVLAVAFLLGQVGPRPVAVRACAVALLAAIGAGVASGRLFVEHPDPRTLARTVVRGEATVEAGPVRWNQIARTALLWVGHRGGPEAYLVQDNGLSNVRVYAYREGRQAEWGLHRDHGLAWRIGRTPHEILVMFAGAGRDMVLLDQYAGGTARITGVELNPVVVGMALRPALRGFGLASFFARPDIDLVVSEGRDFLDRDRTTYDLVHVANNGAVFANRTGHTRKFLDTREAMAAYLDSLAPDGLIVFSSQPVGEKVRSFLELFPERGLPDLRGAMVVYGWPRWPDLHTLVLSPNGLGTAEVERIEAEVARGGEGKVVLYAPGMPDAEDALQDVARGFGEQRRVTDDRPFPRSLQLSRQRPLPRASDLADLAWVSAWIKVFTVVLFGAVSAAVAVAARALGGPRARVPLSWALYLLLTGVGYMCVEIGLIAKTELFIGNPLYAVAVNLTVFLVFNALGSLLEDRAAGQGSPWVLLGFALGGIAWGLGATALSTRFLLSVPLAAKVALVALAVSPAAVALGRFYPHAVGRLVHAGRSEAIPATYGLTTLSSVWGSTFAAALMIEIGFSRVIALGGAAYLCACVVAARAASGRRR